MSEFEEPIVGFRVWYALARPWEQPRTYDGALRSVGSDSVWTTGTIAARCSHRFVHEAPALGCTCGLYAYDRLETAKLYEGSLKLFADPFDEGFQGVLVMGAVLLWGRVTYAEVVGRYGQRLLGMTLGLRLRAQCGRILALRDDGEVTRLASRLYNVPAVPERYLEAVAREHGRQLRVPAPGFSLRTQDG